MCSFPYLAHLFRGHVIGMLRHSAAGNQEHGIHCCPPSLPPKTSQRGYLSTLLFSTFPFFSLFPLHFSFVQKCRLAHGTWLVVVLICPTSWQKQAYCDGFIDHVKLSNSIWWSFTWLQICSCHSFRLPRFVVVYFKLLTQDTAFTTLKVILSEPFPKLLTHFNEKSKEKVSEQYGDINN